MLLPVVSSATRQLCDKGLISLKNNYIITIINNYIGVWMMQLMIPEAYHLFSGTLLDDKLLMILIVVFTSYTF